MVDLLRQPAVAIVENAVRDLSISFTGRLGSVIALGKPEPRREKDAEPHDTDDRATNAIGLVRLSISQRFISHSAV
jgi:hypothetical protein